MKRILRSVYALSVLFGIDPLKTIMSISGLPAYFRDLKRLINQRKVAAKEFRFGKPYLCLGDRFTDSGSAGGHYFHQDLLVARRIYLNNPHRHVDIGSRIDGFVAHVAAYRVIEVIDIRPLSSKIQNVIFKQADFSFPIQENLYGYCDSLSCLHAIEHFGLGRYGDPVNYNGYIQGLDNLYRMLQKGGKLYLSVPIGLQRIEFNAHRVFSVGYLLECLNVKYRIDNFSFVDDNGDLHENIPISDEDIRCNFGCVYGCGIFELTKQ
ncbi:DUF268 domain-containing protein [Geotalea sp. SG265]|uniref:DUF268 domain-containing protein n=1 Tax=Geotalea sp. SG265 TaxID=2922867 RepID=UPI001FAF0D34|nr:DUF268 domain-containing protein [Geotalea sp. SG265]